MEFQEYTRMQENKLQECVDLLNLKMSSSFEAEHEKVEVDDENFGGEHFERSYSKSSFPVEYNDNEVSEYDQDGFYSNRSDVAEQVKSPMPDEASPSPLPASLPPAIEHQSSKIPRPPPPRRAVMPEDIKTRGLPPIPGHVVSLARVAAESNVKIFQEKLPNYNKNSRSAGYGKNTKNAPQSNVQNKLQVVLPPLKNTQYRSQQSFSNQEKCHQNFVQYNEVLTVKRSAIKGIVKPNLIRKDLMKLRDPTVRPRGAPKQTDVIEDIVVERGATRHQQQMQMMIPQPPPRPNNKSGRSRIPRLPTIQQHQGISGIPRPCPPLPQPPTMSRSRPGVSHRTYVARGIGFPFPRRQ